jgi:hypothetical protein
MKIFKTILPVALLAVILSSCGATMPLMLTDNANGGKVGTAEFTTVFGFGPMHKDLSLAKAAKNGGITKISTVDYYVQGGLFKTTYQIIVTGE